jgi:hypothetical protein
VENSLKHKSYLILLKYIPHLTAFMYIIYTTFQFLDVDLIIVGHLVHISIVSWIFMLLSSIVFRFCYVHRIPLYYILFNDLTTVIDYYIGIPVSDFVILQYHIILIGLLIFGYTYYYITYITRKRLR